MSLESLWCDRGPIPSSVHRTDALPVTQNLVKVSEKKCTCEALH